MISVIAVFLSSNLVESWLFNRYYKPFSMTVKAVPINGMPSVRDYPNYVKAIAVYSAYSNFVSINLL